MSRSMRHVWRATSRNVPGLPPCPRDLNEPSYASLLFDTSCLVSDTGIATLSIAVVNLTLDCFLLLVVELYAQELWAYLLAMQSTVMQLLLQSSVSLHISRRILNEYDHMKPSAEALRSWKHGTC